MVDNFGSKLLMKKVEEMVFKIGYWLINVTVNSRAFYVPPYCLEIKGFHHFVKSY